MANIVVVDTNVIITAIISGSPYVIEKLADPRIEIVAPKFLIVELFKHSPRIQKTSSLTDEEILDILSGVVEFITLYDEADISIGSWAEAHRLVGKIDEKDAPFIALALELNARLWTNDRPLIRGLKRSGFLKFYP
jgi:putative PIN family toxin of toxin-antitoxin system